MRPGRVVHAAQTLSGQLVAVGEQHVGVGVVVAVAQLTRAAEHHGVAVVTRSAPELETEQDEVFFCRFRMCLNL